MILGMKITVWLIMYITNYRKWRQVIMSTVCSFAQAKLWRLGVKLSVKVEGVESGGTL